MNFTTTCAEGGRVNYAGDLTFSSDDGGVTATTLIDQLQDHILSMEEIVVTVEGYGPLTINANCPIKQQNYYNVENNACSDSSGEDLLYIVLIVVVVILCLLLIVTIIAITAIV